MKPRVILHPILIHPRSRYIFLIFSILTIAIGGFLIYQSDSVIESIGLNPSLGSPSGNAIVSILISRNFFVSVSLLAVLLATTLTAQFVVGPIKRIEEWILEWKQRRSVGELQLRQQDKFERLSRLLNEFRAKYYP